MAAELDLKLLTLNCWGLWVVSKHRKQRFEAIGDWLASTSNDRNSIHHAPASSYDFVCLQEVWVRSDGDYLRQRARESGLNYSRLFYSGALGSGLLILSRRPILDSRIFSFPLNGNPLHAIQGDFFVGKAAASVLVDLGEMGKAEVYCTHFYSPGDQYPEHDHYRRAHRLSQAWELARMVNASAEKGRHVFVCGDLNSTPQSLILQLLTSHGSLTDSWTVTNPIPEFSARSPEESITSNGVTCDSPANFYSAGKHLSALALRDYGKRLDYILYRPAQPTLANPQRSITCLNTSVEFTQPVPGHAFSYSDHFAVSAVFRLSSSAVEQKYPTPLFPGQLESVILALGRHAQNVDKESALLLRIFGACVLAGFVLIPVAASFQPLRYLNWIFPLLSTLVGVVGATALYTGFVGCNWERGALKNAIEEMEAELNLLNSSAR